jgi:putative hemin transport protein
MNALVELPSCFKPGATIVYQALVGVRQAHPRLGLQGWSRLLSTSEGELQASRLGQESVWPLQDVFSLLYLLPSLGEVQLLTFNELGWAQYQGCFTPPDLCLDDPHQLGLQFVTQHLELKLMLENWYWGCLVEEENSQGETEKSLQFFNRQGQRFAKIQALESGDQAAWLGLQEAFKGMGAVNPSRPLFSDAGIQVFNDHPPQDLGRFQLEWRRMADPNQISYLLARHQVNYLSGLQALGPKLARQVSLNALTELLTEAALLPRSQAKPGLKLAFYTDACVHSCRGNLQPPRLKHREVCIGYPAGCLHFNPQLLEEAWVVRKPQGDGWISSLELFSDAGQRVFQVSEDKLSLQPENLVLRELFNALQ